MTYSILGPKYRKLLNFSRRILTARRRLAVFVILIVFLANACAIDRSPGIAEGNRQRQILLFSAERAIQDEWQPILIRGETEYRVTAESGKVAIRAVGQRSASGLMRRVRVDAMRCPIINWSWRLDRLQESADITVKEKEDVAAALFLLFGDPGFLPNPRRVPSLRYVWTNERTPVEALVDSPYLPGVVKSIVVRSGSTPSDWFIETRNVLKDFERAFGYVPQDAIEAIVLFTDNDQTQEPVIAYYGWGRMVCQTDRP